MPQSTMLKLKAPTLALSLLFFTSVVQAEVKRYNIEIVIFENSTSRYINSEQWPVIPHQEENEFSVNKVIHVTHNSSNALADYARKLKLSSRYNVLLHQSWQQTGLGNAEAISIPINTSEPNTEEKEKLTIFSSALLPSASNKKELKSNIQGSLKLILGRFLHIHTDILYKRLNQSYRTTSPVLNETVFNEFQIKTQRRMRSNELHYIDHPLLGMLVIVTPLKQKQLPDE